MAGNRRSRAWQQAHSADPHVRQARQAGYRSRSAYKLLEIARRDRLLRPGMTVVDLGAAPGGWSQVAAQELGPGGRVIAVDLLPAAPVPGVEFIQGDVCDAALRARVIEALADRCADVVICDMAPNLTGRRDVDEANTAGLNAAAAEFAAAVLAPGGSLLIKTFHGEGFEALRRGLPGWFGRVQVRKPQASRSQSSEVYVLARDRRGGPGGAVPPPAVAAVDRP